MNEHLIEAGLDYVQTRLTELEQKRAHALVDADATLTDEEIDELAVLRDAEKCLIRQAALERHAQERFRAAMAEGCAPEGRIGDWIASGQGRLVNPIPLPDADVRGLARIRRALSAK